MTASGFPALIAGHLIGDWVVQTDWQAANKVRPTVRVGTSYETGKPKDYWQSWRANQAHMLGYHAALVACAAPFVRPKRLAFITAVSWLTHSFIDRRWPVRWLMAHTGSGPFSETTWGPMCVDQALHLSILALLAEGRERDQ